MAKTFGTGADPKGLVNRGVEGSGAAQIFRPSQAVQDFVSRQARGEQQKAAQKKAEAKAKVEKQKVDDKAIQDLLDVDFIGWNEKRNKQILGDFSILQDEAAQEVARGGDISQSKDLLIKKKILEQKIDLMKLERTEYSNAVKDLAQIAKDPDYDPVELKTFADNIGLFEQGGIGENDFSLLIRPTKRKIIDYEKAVAQDIKNLQPNQTPVIDKNLGVIITTTEVPESEVETKLKGFKTTAAYKQKVNSLVESGEFDKDSAEKFLDQDYKIRTAKKVGYRPLPKGSAGSGFGNGVADTYRAEYRNVRPSDINIKNYGITPDEIIIGGNKAPYLRSVSLLSSDKKSPVPLSFTTNIQYKRENAQGVMEDVALTSATPVTPKQLVEYKAVNGNKYLFIFNVKGVGDAAAVIDSGNKQDFETYFLPKGKTIEKFLEEGEKSSKVNQQAAPSKPTVNKFEKYKRQ